VSAWQEIIARPLRALHLGSIRNRILLLAVLATLVPALATTCVSYERNRDSLSDQLDQALRSASSEAARETALWLTERLGRAARRSAACATTSTQSARGFRTMKRCW